MNTATFHFKKHGLQTYCNLEDGHLLLKYKWYLVFKKGIPYVFATIKKSGKKKTIYLAREVVNAPNGTLVDHIDGNTLNNTRSNLRLVDKRKNAQNMKANKNTTSIFKGVCWDKTRNKWRSTIKINNKQIQLGRFSLEIEAAKAYNKAAIEFFGEFARLNEV